jgi:hypothetical protein
MLALLGGPPLLAAPALSVQLQRAAQAPPALGYYAGQPASLRLDFAGVGQCAQIAAELYQQAATLETPIEQSYSLECANAHMIGEVDVLGIEFQFLVPEVERTVQLEWRFSRCQARATGCEPIGAVAFTAYPIGLLEPLAAWAADNVVQVVDQSGRLQAALEANEVEFLEHGAPLPSAVTVVSLAVAPVDEEVLRELGASGPVIVFRERAPGLPLVLLKFTGEVPIIDVRVPVVGRLSSDPAAVQTLLELFRLLRPSPRPS